MKLITSLCAVILAGMVMVSGAHAESQAVCAGSVPAGWIKIDDRWEPAKCGKPGVFSTNVWIIERYDNQPAGSVINACADAVPRGWSMISQKWDPTKCGRPGAYTANIMTIKRLNDAPSRAASDRTRGIVFIVPASNLAARIETGRQVLASPEGQHYESSWAEIMQTILADCIPFGSTDQSDLGTFTFVADISATGVVSSVEVDPGTDASRCFALRFGKAQLPSPPASLITGQKVTVADDIVITQ